MPAGPNVFARLHKWAARQDENFCTESFALVLQTLLDREPAAGTRMLRALTHEFLQVPPGDAQNVDVRPQVETTEGRPDLELRWLDRLVVMEVKVGSELHKGQLEGYRRYLMENEPDYPHNLLALLTWYPPEFDEGMSIRTYSCVGMKWANGLMLSCLAS